jgi:hypothetical protein
MHQPNQNNTVNNLDETLRKTHLFLKKFDENNSP